MDIEKYPPVSDTQAISFETLMQLTDIALKGIGFHCFDCGAETE